MLNRLVALAASAGLAVAVALAGTNAEAAYPDKPLG